MKRMRWYLCLLVFCIVSMGGCKQAEDGTVYTEDETVYTEDEVYIHSYECGYLYGYEIPKSYHIVIETGEQLEYAIQNYGICEISGKCKEMIEQHSIDDYTFVLRYDEVSSGGYYYHVDRVIIKPDSVLLKNDKKSHSARGDAQSQVMGGFFHMAAIPKEYLEGCDYSGMNAIFPGETESKE